MKYESFAQLPASLRRYIERFGWPPDAVQRWLNQPIPALGGRTVLEALSDGDREAVNNVVLRTGDAMGVEGYLD